MGVIRIDGENAPEQVVGLVAKALGRRPVGQLDLSVEIGRSAACQPLLEPGTNLRTHSVGHGATGFASRGEGGEGGD